MDETYAKLNGKWLYLYKAVDRYGDTVDFFLCKYRNKSAAIIIAGGSKHSCDSKRTTNRS